VIFQNTLEENLIKKEIMPPFVPENIYQRLTPFFGTLSNFLLA
jgi:hypothetical protein